MEGSEIPKVASEHLGPQPLPEISHCDCAGVNCTQKSRQRGAHKMGTLGAQIYYEEFRQFVWNCLHKKASHCAVFAFFVFKWGEYKTRLD